MSNHSIIQRILQTVAEFEAGTTSAFTVDESIELHRTSLESVPRESMDKLRALGAKLLSEDFSDLEREQMGLDDETADTIQLIREILNSIEDPGSQAFERVYVEDEWYDGPRAGIADIHGVPHRFQSLFDEEKDDCLSTFLVWPVSREELELGLERWRTFVEWNDRYEAGEAGMDTHPACPDQIEAPADARIATARFKRIDKVRRYERSGPDYLLCWCFSPSGE